MRNSTINDRTLDAAISDALTELALDLRWSFNHSADRLWKQLDHELWDLTHNPWVLLQTVSREKLQTITSDPGFQGILADLHREKALIEKSESWFQTAHPHSGVSTVAYFSMEFMLSEALPISLGGLGNVTAISLKQQATWVCRWSALACSINRAISARRLMHKATSKLCTHSMILGSFRFGQCANQAANGCAWRPLSRLQVVDQSLAGPGRPGEIVFA